MVSSTRGSTDLRAGWIHPRIHRDATVLDVEFSSQSKRWLFKGLIMVQRLLYQGSCSAFPIYFKGANFIRRALNLNYHCITFELCIHFYCVVS